MTLLKRLMIGLVRAYQYLLSPFIPASCRFYPSCSHYAVEALETHGAFYGGWLTFKRLLRCHPWCDFGFDPVPERRSEREAGVAHDWSLKDCRSRSLPKHGHS